MHYPPNIYLSDKAKSWLNRKIEELTVFSAKDISVSAGINSVSFHSQASKILDYWLLTGQIKISHYVSEEINTAKVKYRSNRTHQKKENHGRTVAYYQLC